MKTRKTGFKKAKFKTKSEKNEAIIAARRKQMKPGPSEKSSFQQPVDPEQPGVGHGYSTMTWSPTEKNILL